MVIFHVWSCWWWTDVKKKLFARKLQKSIFQMYTIEILTTSFILLQLNMSGWDFCTFFFFIFCTYGKVDRWTGRVPATFYLSELSSAHTTQNVFRALKQQKLVMQTNHGVVFTPHPANWFVLPPAQHQHHTITPLWPAEGFLRRFGLWKPSEWRNRRCCGLDRADASSRTQSLLLISNLISNSVRLSVRIRL